MPDPLDSFVLDRVHYTYDAIESALGKVDIGIVPKLIDAGRNAVCSVYQATPSGFVDSIETGLGFITPQHILMDNLCRPVNKLPPPPPPAPITGGQCECVMYHVSGDVWFEGAYQQTLARNVPGKITNVGVGSGGTDIGFDYGAPACVGGRVKFVDGNAQEIASGRFQIRNWAVARVDQQPDDCGNLVPVYPPALPSPGDLVTHPTIQITPTLSAPVTVEVKPVFNVNPTIAAPVVLVNTGGLSLHFDLGGVTISPTFDNSTHNTFPDTSPGSPKTNPVKAPSKHCADDIDVLEIIKRLDRIGRELEECCERDRPYPPPDATKVLTTLLDTANSGLYDLPANTFQVAVRIVTQPVKVKTQAGILAPRVLYAGWAWFGAANNMSERMQVDSEFKLYSPPRYISNTFGFTLYQGLTATITAYSIKPKPTPP